MGGIERVGGHGFDLFFHAAASWQAECRNGLCGTFMDDDSERKNYRTSDQEMNSPFVLSIPGALKKLTFLA